MALWTMKTLVGIFALKSNLGLPTPEWESPMEGLFCQEAQDPVHGIDGLELQYPIGPYRVDFAIPDIKLAIEIDGHAYHSSPEQLERDRNRQREIEALGWHVLRFSGSKIYNDVSKCVQTVRLIVLNTRYQQGLPRPSDSP